MTFSQKVYEVVSRIPKGSVLSYKEVARLAGRPKAYRAVGNILNKNPFSYINRRGKPLSNCVPCHRVIRSDGKIGGFGGFGRANNGSQKKRELLISEGVVI